MTSQVTRYLYSSFSFYFSDHGHPLRKEEEHLQQDLTKYCDWCTDYFRIKSLGGTRYKEHWSQCWQMDFAKEKHIDKVPPSDLLEMKEWLDQIGPQNRSYVKKLSLLIAFRDTTRFPPPQRVRASRQDWVKPVRCNGTYLLQNLRYLSDHVSNLTEIKILIDHEEVQGYSRFKNQERDRYDTVDNLYNITRPGSRLRTALCKIKSLRKLGFQEMPPEYFDSLDPYVWNAWMSVSDVRKDIADVESIISGRLT
ncbi:uncharacterized protein KY384_006311 [Bacidia gigantensis]|uniref:uncharacterized protein n=1 Tax=Bacidia gigantensis TaxID=2732470 RepID=UPI001D059975|nr:uncharacterized protein KY384_006311 [Bacidia gigantensis]KAG8528624.1 hypothetical protein KY384_006311 [Bacidia gigantensis]